MKNSLKKQTAFTALTAVTSLFCSAAQAAENVELVHAYSSAYTVTGAGLSSLRQNSGFTVLTQDFGSNEAVYLHVNQGNGWEDVALNVLDELDDQQTLWSLEIDEGFSLNGDQSSGRTFEFVIKYESANGTFWDNNNRQNYYLDRDSGHMLVSKSAYVYEPARSRDNNQLSGSVAIESLGNPKFVNIIYTTNNWASSQSAQASWHEPCVPVEISGCTNNPGTENAERWDFTLEAISTGTTVEYYVEYEVNGQTIIDNNYGENYVVASDEGIQIFSMFVNGTTGHGIFTDREMARVGFGDPGFDNQFVLRADFNNFDNWFSFFVNSEQMSDIRFQLGDNNDDGIAEVDGDQIDLPHGAVYELRFDGTDYSYTIEEIDLEFANQYLGVWINNFASDNALSLVGDHTWEITHTFTGDDLKFPVLSMRETPAEFNEFIQSWGDSGNDGILENRGSQIQLPCAGEYQIQVNMVNKTYVVNQLSAACDLESVQPSMHLRGSFNSWRAKSMELVSNNTWQTRLLLNEQSGEYKFDVFGDWSRNFGDDNQDQVADASGDNINIFGRGEYIITLNDQTLEYSATPATHENLSPEADAGPDVTVELGSSVTLNGSNSNDPDGEITSYSWSNGWGNGAMVTNTPSSTGEFIIELTVTDDKGATDTDSVRVTVVEENDEFESNEPSMHLRGSFNFWGTQVMELVSDNTWQATILLNEQSGEYKFDVFGDWSRNFGDDNQDQIADAGGDNILIFGRGDYIITFNDQTLEYSTTSKNIGNQSPEAVITGPSTVLVGDSFSLSGAESSDPDGSIISYTWEDGQTGPTANFVFSAPGTFTITLTVEDDDGASMTTVHSITVEQAGGAITANFVCNNGNTFFGQNVYVVGDASFIGGWDPANAIKLEPTSYPTWTGSISDIPANSTINWKCIKKDSGENVIWQSGANNSFTTSNGPTTLETVGSF